MLVEMVALRCHAVFVKMELTINRPRLHNLKEPVSKCLFPNGYFQDTLVRGLAIVGTHHHLGTFCFLSRSKGHYIGKHIDDAVIPWQIHMTAETNRTTNHLLETNIVPVRLHNVHLAGIEERDTFCARLRNHKDTADTTIAIVGRRSFRARSASRNSVQQLGALLRETRGQIRNVRIVELEQKTTLVERLVARIQDVPRFPYHIGCHKNLWNLPLTRRSRNPNVERNELFRCSTESRCKDTEAFECLELTVHEYGSCRPADICNHGRIFARKVCKAHIEVFVALGFETRHESSNNTGQTSCYGRLCNHCFIRNCHNGASAFVDFCHGLDDFDIVCSNNALNTLVNTQEFLFIFGRYLGARNVFRKNKIASCAGAHHETSTRILRCLCVQISFGRCLSLAFHGGSSLLFFRCP